MERLPSTSRSIFRLSVKTGFICKFCRNFSTMKAWRIHSYSSSDPIQLNERTKVPTIDRPNDVLVKVKAASLNPLDARMKDGYGKTIVGVMRQMDQCSLNSVSEFPLTLGRDCSGVVLDTGRNVKEFKRGDEVWCALGAERQGSFAEYVLASKYSMSLKPKSLNFVDSASMPYVACTVWSALCTVGRLNTYKRPANMLIHGGSGGIGTFAIQLAKAYNAEITTTCSTDAFELVQKIGADNVVDYKASDVYQQLSNKAPYDIIFDCVNTEFTRKTSELLRLWRGSLYVTVSGPLLKDSDDLGLTFGLCKSTVSFFNQFAQNVRNGRLTAWAYVIPNGEALKEVAKLVDAGKIRPVIEKVYSFSEIPEALEKVATLHGRGKVVVDFNV